MQILAMDLGKFKSVGCVYDTESHAHRFCHVATTPAALHDRLLRIEPDRLVIEVGSPAGWVYDLATALGIEVQVANPSHEGWRWRNVKRKTDKLDALKLAQLSAVDQLPQVHMPGRAVRQMRALLQYRSQVLARRTRIKNTIRSLVHREGRSMPGGAKGWTRESLTVLASWACPLEQAEAAQLWRGMLQEELAALSSASSHLARIEAKLDALAAGDDRVARLQSIPCVGPRTAELLVAVLDDPHRFATAKEVGSYAGLTPRQFQSGQMDRSGHISKQGHRQLRRMLVEVSWLALRYNEPLRRVYERICRGSRTRRKVAIVAVARKLLIWAWALLRDGSRWRGAASMAA